MQKIVTTLWFDTNAEDAARFYTSVIKNSKIGSISYYGEGTPLPAGTVLTVRFKLDGQEFLAFNGGPNHQFTDAISLTVYCKTQKEIDRLWEALTAEGKVVQCGWLKDKYGVSWQIVPNVLKKMMAHKDSERAWRVLQALMPMTKLDIKTLKKAFERK